jgi:hypothetical protein
MLGRLYFDEADEIARRDAGREFIAFVLDPQLNNDSEPIYGWFQLEPD